MRGLRVPLRLARREVRRRPGRTALVAGLVALPVAAMAIAVVLIRTDRSTTPLEEWRRSVGAADAVTFSQVPVPPGATPVPEQPAVALPAGSRTVTVSGMFLRVRTADGRRSDLDLRDLPLLDPITAGIHDLIDGRAPTAAGEIALGSQLADRLGVDVGDDLVLERPSARFVVVGLVEPVGCLSCSNALVAPGELRQVPGEIDGGVQLIDLPDGISDADARALRDSAMGALELRIDSRDQVGGAYRGQDDDSPVRWSLVLGALVLTVAGIVISAAFAVGARRQLVTLGQLSASGTAPATVRTMLMLQGTVTGAIGAVAGLALAAAGLVGGKGLVERFFNERIDQYTVRLGDLALVVLIGVGAATVAALLPARTAARIPTLAALAGRRPLAPVPRRVIGWGVASVAGGLGLLALAVVGSQSGASGELWAYVAILGGVAELLGACALAPVIVARLEPLAARLRGPARLGARGLARHRSRTGAVVSAVAAAGALAVASNALILGGEAQAGDVYELPRDVVVARSLLPPQDDRSAEVSQPVADELRAEIAATVAGSAASEIRAAVVPAGDSPTGGYWETTEHADGPRSDTVYAVSQDAVIADPAMLDALRASGELRDTLDEVGVVVLTEEESGPVSLRAPDGRVVEGRAVNHRYVLGYFSSLLLTEERATELGLSIAPIATLVRADHDLTSDERGALEDLQWDVQDSHGVSYTSMEWNYPRSGPSPLQLELILTGLALVFSLFVVGVSLALAAAESKDERDVLTTAGAPPAALARSAAVRAWLLAGIGGAMAIPVGFLPVVVFANAASADTFSDRFPLIFPTRTALLLLALVPVVVAAVSWAGSASAQRLRPVRVSTATFE